MIPPAQRGGRPRETDMREVMNAVHYVLGTGCHMAAVTEGFTATFDGLPPLWEWSRYGMLDRIHHTLLMACREAEGHEA